MSALASRRRAPALLLGCVGLWLLAAMPAQAASCPQWPAWDAFKKNFISADGRVIDHGSARQHTVSEGQAYAMFFALVAGDDKSFAQLLRWTEDNLAQGDLSARLPAWQWGRRDDASWGVIDANPASDADVFIAYVLGEAARLWQQRYYRILSKLIGARILREEVVNVPGLGPTLLPAPIGFVEANTWRLNPSYSPPMLLRGLARLHPEQAWASLVPSTQRVLREPAVHGFAPDWVVWRDGGFVVDEKTLGLGSYDAIRVYLWAGMLAAEDPDRAALLQTLKPMAEQTAQLGAPPEKIDTARGTHENLGPSGFSAALLPMLSVLQMQPALNAQLARLQQSAAKDTGNYYDQVLRLFGQGWQQGRYRFDAQGRLSLQWTAACIG